MNRIVLLLLCFATVNISLYGSDAKLDISEDEVIEPIAGDGTSQKTCECKSQKPQKVIDMENKYASEASKTLSDAFLAHSKECNHELNTTESIFSEIHTKE